MYQQSRLKNGVRIITHEMKDRHSVSVGIWIGVGGRYEDDRVKGAAHFLEHIVFKGSQGFSCEDIKGEIEGVGGNLNAFTAEEHTCFYAKIPSRHIKKTVGILSDMVFFPALAPKEIRMEKTVILEEIKMYHDLPQYFVLELLDQLLWPEHPLGKSLAGTTQSVSRMTRRTLQQFHHAYYSPSNVVVSACGNVRHRYFMSLISAALRQLNDRKVPSFAPIGDRPPLSSPVHVFTKPTEQTHLALGVPSLPENHPQKHVLQLLHVILGGNMSSRLFHEIRERRGLAYSIGTSFKALSDTGLFMVRAGVDNRKIDETVSLIIQELERIQRKGVGDREFGRAKEYLLGQMLLGMEDSLDHMLWIGEGVLSGDAQRNLADVTASVAKITPADIQALATEMLARDKMKLALIGPLEDAQEKAIRSVFA